MMDKEQIQTRSALWQGCRRVVVKVGSSILTHTRGLDRVNIHRLSDQMAEWRLAGKEVVLVSSGAVAAGLRRLGWQHRPETIRAKQGAAAVGQSLLMQAWEEAFSKYELCVAQVLLTAEDLVDRQRYLNARTTLETLLEWGVIPVLNENDTVAVDEIKFGDNDQLAALIAGLVGADMLVLLTDTEGVYDRDPRQEGASLVQEVREVDDALLRSVSTGKSEVGTGGMLSKVLAAQKGISSGIPVVIASGKERDGLRDVLAGQAVGTLFVPGERSYQGKKLWLAQLSKPAGELVLDAGAVEALVHRGGSLLPVGVVAVRGVFQVGAPVRCVSLEGVHIGVGLSNYPSEEVEKIKGCHSDEIEGRLGYKHSDELIHRNHFVLEKSHESSKGEKDPPEEVASP